MGRQFALLIAAALAFAASGDRADAAATTEALHGPDSPGNSAIVGDEEVGSARGGSGDADGGTRASSTGTRDGDAAEPDAGLGGSGVTPEVEEGESATPPREDAAPDVDG